MVWMQSPAGVGMTGLAGLEGGIPGEAPAWTIGRAGKYGLYSEVCLYNGRIYLSSSGMHIRALSLDDGAPVWEIEVEGHTAAGLCVSNEYLAAGWLVMELDNGGIVANFRELIGRGDIGDYGNLVALDSGFVREIEGDEPDEFVFDPVRREGHFLEVGLKDIVTKGAGSLLYGWRGGAIRCFDTMAGREKWLLRVPIARSGEPMTGAGFSVLEDRLYVQLNRITVWCLDSRTGDVIWKAGPDEIEDNLDPQRCSPPNLMLVAHDRLYLVAQARRGGVFMSFEASSGRLMWESAVNEFQGGCIAGDLIFGVRDMTIPVAWDRYTGEEVWRAKKSMAGAYVSISDGNYVLYASTAGELRCFRWEEPYVSPAKP